MQARAQVRVEPRNLRLTRANETRCLVRKAIENSRGVKLDYFVRGEGGIRASVPVSSRTDASHVAPPPPPPPARFGVLINLVKAQTDNRVRETARSSHWQSIDFYAVTSMRRRATRFRSLFTLIFNPAALSLRLDDPISDSLLTLVATAIPFDAAGWLLRIEDHRVTLHEESFRDELSIIQAQSISNILLVRRRVARKGVSRTIAGMKNANSSSIESVNPS